MATTLALELPWGRFHATPWDRNVNEGVVEWPPSPWRLLRAFYATWRWRAPHLQEDTVLSLLRRLSVPPIYQLPPYQVGHTRHYYPDITHREGARSTDKILDGFVITERRAELVVSWPVDLEVDEREALDELAGQLAYVGRADSICLAKVVSGDVVDGSIARPLEAGEFPRAGHQVVRLLTPASAVEERTLTTSTADVRRERLHRPPGTKFVDYLVPEEMVVRATERRSRSQAAAPTAVRWVVAGPSRPSAHATVTLGHVLRRACMSAYGRLFDDTRSPQLAGKAPDGTPLEGHAHAHYLALDHREEDERARGDTRVESLLLWVRDGIDEDVLAAVATVHLRGLRGHGHIPDFSPLRLGIEAIGSVEDVAWEIVAPDGAKVWESHTPFATVRHRKKETPDEFLQAEIERELHFRDIAIPVRVTRRPGDWLAYRRHRPDRQKRTEATSATGARLEFEEPVTGPLVLGALSHFGLGLFVPIG